MSSRLVIVESPTKARTIKKFLPKGYVVEASMGHVRDLPSGSKDTPAKYKERKMPVVGVDVERNFEPVYIIPSDKKKVITKLKTLLKEADELFVATDEDREGESIGWHLLEALKPKVPVRRMVFHEITKEAIERSLAATRDVDTNLVHAQETRRILDRLYGYTLSPLLWRKIKPKLSAGRVQSIALRLTVDREKERIAFNAGSYWDLKASLNLQTTAFEAKVDSINEKRVVAGKDFDDDTGKIKSSIDPESIVLLNEREATALAHTFAEGDWVVDDIRHREERRSAPAPFITSTLQQEANKKLGLPARETMRVAQKLYEQGFITYMRTDSTHLSKEAIDASRSFIRNRYGADYLPSQPRQYTSNVRNAQEAHEAIRPAGTQMTPVQDSGLTNIEARLYELIWQRCIASQMKDAKVRISTAKIQVRSGADRAIFSASGKKTIFQGHLLAYTEGYDDPQAELDSRDNVLPALNVGDAVTCLEVIPGGHETKPPKRYTDASLIKELETQGVGRPSTYATIIDTIVDRGYVIRRSKNLVPTFVGFATINLLEQHFTKLIDLDFTAQMERVLDDVAEGKADAQPYLERFYHGDDGLDNLVKTGLSGIDARDVSELKFDKWGDIAIRVGKFGPYIELSGGDKPERIQIPFDLQPGDITAETLAELRDMPQEVPLGIHPEHNLPVWLKSGPYGPYVQLGDEEKPKRVSLPKGLAATDVTFEIAVDLLRLPRLLGTHPTTEETIYAGLGRFGPFVRMGKLFASLKKEDDVLRVSLDRALELIQEKQDKTGQTPGVSLGEHPDTGSEMVVRSGKYGPYIKHGRANVNIPKEIDAETITTAQAVALINEKLSKPKKTRSKKK